MICLIKNYLEKRRNMIEKYNIECSNLMDNITTIIGEIIETLKIDDYIKKDYCKSQKLKKEEVLIKLKNLHQRKYKRLSKYKKLVRLYDEFSDIINELEDSISKHNDSITKKRIQDAYKVLGKVEGRILDYQQMESLISNERNQLIVAGAGTGKTTTIVGKVKYLLLTKKLKKEDILVLSFTNTAASEMSMRIQKEINTTLDVMTFHKLGLEIIKSVDKKIPNICNDSRTIIKNKLDELKNNNEYFLKLLNYLYYNRVVGKSEFEFNSSDEYEEYKKANPPKTILNEEVKSYGELDIANFLLYNNIKYQYEPTYIIDTSNTEYGSYHPDFFLPDYNIYIEYYGIDRNGDVPSYFRGAHGKSAKKLYNDSIEWKRKLHKEHGTVLIELFSYERYEGKFLSKLEKLLKDNNVPLSPKSSEDLWEEISKDKDELFEGVLNLFSTIINLIKSNNYTIEELHNLNQYNSNKYFNEIIISLIEPLFNEYNNYLQENNKIDFNDMINKATDYIAKGKYINRYKYVIVDEYQDISKSRYRLLKQLRDSNDYNLFCVGDDWQSIYRFNGSDISFIIEFDKYWGESEKKKIETTYRFSKNIIDISSIFIMKNPYQIRKKLKSNIYSEKATLGEISGNNMDTIMERLFYQLNELPKEATVFFIGRYSFDYKILTSSPSLKLIYDNSSKKQVVLYNQRPDLKMEFITAHSSKGLEADYVFIINNTNGRLGFPSRIENSSIIELLLESYNSYSFDEERRLFYVALTRAKKKVVLMTYTHNKSIFAKELIEDHSEEIKREFFECPRCGGRLIKRSGHYGDFIGCSNYRTNGCKYTRNKF